MKLDVRTDPSERIESFQPFLDGAALFNCFMADEESGVALVFATDELGRRHTYFPDPMRILQSGELQPDPYEECVVEVHGHIELRRISATP